MRAEVLVPSRGWPSRSPARAPLYSYLVPPSLSASIAPGQLVAVPFGERVVAGIVWALDASDDVPSDETDAASTSTVAARLASPMAHNEPTATATNGEPPPRAGHHAPMRLRSIGGILLSRPVLLPAQQALAEQIATYYAAPLSSAARLMLPPGLLHGIRYLLRPAGALDPATASGLPADEAMVLAMLRERGELERDAVTRALGQARARVAVNALVAAGLVVLDAAVAPVYQSARRERRVRLAGIREQRETWRTQARTQLDALPRPKPRRGIAARSGRSANERQAERAAERLLRQLAVLDVLERSTVVTGDANGASDGRETEPSHAWRVEELRRLTRVTPAALAELEAAGLLEQDEAEARHDPLAGRSPQRTQPLPLSPAQSRALRTILGAAGEGTPPRPFLLHGITGSGKTEVYLQALAATLAEGKRGIVLVPEIALTPQAVARFSGRFPGRVALLHSGLSDAERLGEWRRIRDGEADVVVGSRSALFAPVERLGLIVVDEEHEAAYKEERVPSYAAREVAVRLGRITGARVVLGSATPSVESYYRALQGDYTLIELRERAPVILQRDANGTRETPAGAADADPRRGVRRTPGSPQDDTLPHHLTPPALPPVTIVDLRAQLRAGRTSILSEPLHAALSEALARGEQAILFLNRRGTASSVMCRECGYAVRCARCDVSMTYHASEEIMLCHYCGQHERPPTTCPVCWSASIRYFGLGTERVELAVKQQFPAARVLRWDRDTAKTRHVHEELLRAFAERRADVLVGTQMIAKGLDLPGVTLVGVVSADIALFLPDFRASERAFQLLTQVAGRAGRGERPGRVLVQTFNPDHFCIQAAAQHDYASFIHAELIARERYGYPPFRRFVKWVYEHRDRYTAQIEATVLAERIERLIAQLALPDADVVGPAPAFLERLRGRYRWQVILRAADPLPLLAALSTGEMSPAWSVDLDPINTA